MNNQSYSSRKRGSTLGLAVVLILVLFLLGSAFLYFTQLFSCDKEVANASDAGALAAAQQILTVTLTPAQLATLPSEFLGLGVDSNGVVCPSGKDSNGNPALFNEIAYNNCAVYTIEIALNAAALGTSAAISNANTLIAATNQFAADLDGNIKSSSNLSNAATELMASNPLHNLPKKIMEGKVSSPTTLVTNSLQLAYYTSTDPTTGNTTSNDFFPTSFTSKSTQIADWVNQMLSSTASPNNGPKYISAAKPFNFNQITGVSGFKGEIALVPFKPNQLTHLVSVDSTTAFHSSIASLTNAGITLPHNALQLTGQSNAPNTDNGVMPNLLVCSAAVVDNAPPYEANLPSTGSSGSGSTAAGSSSSGSGNSGNSVPDTYAPAYVAIINGGDFQTSLNSNGLSASFLQSKGYSNVNLTPSTNLAFNGSKTDIFDALNWASWYNVFNTSDTTIQGGDWIIIGTSSLTGLLNIYQSQGQAGWTKQVTYGKQNFPANNYNNIVDNPGLGSTIASIPFVFMADYANSNGVSMSPQYTVNASLDECVNDFSAWINYNRSQGGDGLGHNANLDPLKALGGSPAKFKANPNFIVPNTLISSTSGFMQTMTLADALKMVDICVCHDGTNVFNGTQPNWLDNLMPVIASNYGYNYLPDPVGEYKPNGVTAIEYTKAQIIALHAGLGLSEYPPAPPSNPGIVYLPGPGDNYLSIDSTLPNFPAASKVSSGMRYFQAYDTSGNRAHYAWPEPANCPKFETAGTPWQYLQNMNILNNGGKFNPNDQYYNALLNLLLSVVKQMNSSLTMNDLTTALNGVNVDLGQKAYLVYDSTQKKLVMLSTLPSSLTYKPADSDQSIGGYGCSFPIAGTVELEMSGVNDTLADTAALPNSTISYNGQNVTPAPYGDSEVHNAPYNITSPCTPNGYILGGVNIIDGKSIMATDTMTFWPSSGANNNHGELHLNETAGSTFENLATN